MKLLNFSILILSTSLFINCTGRNLASTNRSVASQGSWSSCYNSEDNKLYFFDSASSEGRSPKAPSQTFYQAPKTSDGEDIFLSSSVICGATRTLDQAFDGPEAADASAPVSFMYKNKKYLLTHWGNSSAAKHIIVISPGKNAGSVQTACKFQTLGDDLSYKVEKGILKIGVFGYKNDDPSKGTVLKYEDCLKK